MHKALELARQAHTCDEVPVGAIIVKDGAVISSGHNLCITSHDPTAHAEIVAIRNACTALKSEFLSGCSLYVTLEPCPMCASAIANARIETVYFGAYDPKSGGVDHGARVFEHTHFKPKAVGGICEEEAKVLMQTFFKEKRT